MKYNYAAAMLAVAVVGGGALPGVAGAAPFTAGDVVVVRVGDGAGLHTGAAGDPVFLDEYTTDGRLVQSIELPAASAGAQHALVLTGGGLVGTGGSEGLITRSADGRSLVVAGYGRDVGGTGPVSSTNPATVPRVVAKIAAGGAVDTSTALSDFGGSTGSTVRGVATVDGTGFWLTGAINGGGQVPIRYAAAGASTSTPLSSTITAAGGLRGVGVFGGQLAVSGANPSPSPRIGLVGTGTPTDGGQTITSLASVIDTTAVTPNAFALLDLNPAVAGPDTAYVADEDALTSNTDGEIRKYVADSGGWHAAGSTPATDVRGIVAIPDGSGTVTLLATTGGGTTTCPQGVCQMPSGGGGALYKVIDNSGTGGTLSAAATTIATPPANTGFRGIALAPELPRGVAGTPPTCTGATASTPYGAAVTITVACTDPAGGHVTRRVVGAPRNGTLGSFDDVTGAVTYTPKSGATGPDTFSVAGDDALGLESRPVIVTVSIGAAPPVPVVPRVVVKPPKPIRVALGELHHHGRTLTLTVRCLGTALPNCRGTLIVRLRHRTHGVASLGRESYIIGKGTKKTLKLVVSEKSYRLLRRRRVAVEASISLTRSAFRTGQRTATSYLSL